MSSTQSAEQLLQDMMTWYDHIMSSVYPDMKKLREVLTQLSDQQILDIIQQRYSELSPVAYALLIDHTTALQHEYSVRRTPLQCAAFRDHTEIISTLLTSLQSSAYRLKLLMVMEETPLHEAAYWGHTDSVKSILNCLAADQQIQIMSVQDLLGKTAIQTAERRGHTDTVRVLREYQQKAENLMRERRQEQLRMSDEQTRQRLSGINSQHIIP